VIPSEIIMREYYTNTLRLEAVTPDEAAKSLVEWAEKLDISKTGQYWAPRGAGDIGTAPHVLGNDLPTPLQLPW
jgi:hypothetical protein